MSHVSPTEREETLKLLLLLQIFCTALCTYCPGAVFLKSPVEIYCTSCVADATRVYIRGWMQMVFTIIWFILLKQIIIVRHRTTLTLVIATIYIQNNSYWFTILHTLCLMVSWCCVIPVLLSSWFPHGSLVSSAVADQLLILLLARWARPPLFPPSRADPISLRVHALTHPSVRYTLVWMDFQKPLENVWQSLQNCTKTSDFLDGRWGLSEILS